MKETVFIANTYGEAEYMLDKAAGVFQVKDLVAIKKHPKAYIFSGDNRYFCTSINSTITLRGTRFETIYLHENISHKFMREIFPSLHYRGAYYYMDDGRILSVQ